MSERFTPRGQTPDEEKKNISTNSNPQYFRTGNAEFDRGREIGRDVFYSPEMQDMAGSYKDLGDGYASQAYAPLKKEALSQADGAREAYIRQMASRQARAGIGGARAKAAQSSVNQGLVAAGADAERKFTVDNADLKKQGQQDYTSFLMNQKFGELGTGLGYAQLGSGERSKSAQMEIANKKPEQSFLQRVFGGVL